MNRLIYDYSKLNGKIVEVFKTKKKYAKAIGLSETSVIHKLNNTIEFKQSEIRKSCEVLNIDTKEIPLYFFSVTS